MDEEKTYDELSLFGKKGKPDHYIGWLFYQKGVSYNEQVNIYDIVRNNENFYVGKQWEGVESAGLPTPSINFIKRSVGFTTATITSENVKVNASVMSNAVGKSALRKEAKYLNNEFAAINERNSLPKIIRTFVRNAAVDGDSCIYTYWDAEAETGQKSKGQITHEVIENTRVFFGTPSSREVQDQEWIIVIRRKPVRLVKMEARDNGIKTWKAITSDYEGTDDVDESKQVDGLVTVCTMFWRDDDSGNIWAFDFTKESEVSKPKDLKIKLYPFVWLCWDPIQDSYHGQALVTSLIPNQVAVNRTMAMAIVSNDRAAYPRTAIDSTRVKKLTNQVGAVIPITGGDINSAVKIIDGAPVSPQIFQFIDSIKTGSEESIGATAVAMGDTRPDNTSAIIALQRAAATPNDSQKQNINDAIEALHRIDLEFIANYYGKRFVEEDEIPSRIEDAIQFAQQVNPDIEAPESIPIEFDFSVVKSHSYVIKLEAGASTYYSEIASITTLENLLNLGVIDVVDFLQRIPDDYVPDRLGLISDIKKRRQEQMNPMGAMGGMPPMGGGEAPTPIGQQGVPIAEQGAKDEIPTGGGYGDLQRKVGAGNMKGIV